MQPIIKWTGSKRFQAPQIVNRFPKEIDTYYECFLGGGSVLGELMERVVNGTTWNVRRFICIDTNEDLICIWKMIKNFPDKLCDEYENLYNLYNKFSDYDYKKEIYYKIKDQYNILRRNRENPELRGILFNWLLRNCFNGLVRYSKKGDFNTSCHFTRNGIQPDKFRQIVNEWSKYLNICGVNFFCASYKDVIDLNRLKDIDILYCDPPYMKDEGMYDYDKFDYKEFFDYLRKTKCQYYLSYDGKSGKANNTFDMPKDLYDTHEYIASSQSSFKRLVKGEYVDVYDSLYIKNAKE